MRENENWPRVAVVGAGAVGGYFGGMLAKAGAPVMMIGRAAFVEAAKKNGLFLDAAQFKGYIPVEASTELKDVRDAEIVLFCVKTTDKAVTSRALAPLLASGALVVSMQNGVDNAAQIRAAAGIDVVSAAVYIAASVPEPGRVKHRGLGDLVVGPRNSQSERVSVLFERAGVGCRIAEDIEGELWAKLTWNCALNAISALGRATYGQIAANPNARKLVETAVYELLAVARAAGVHPPGFAEPQVALEESFKIAAQLTGAYSSTAQDMMRGKRTEVDSLNGYIARRGAELGVATPIHQALYTLVKLAEGES